MAKHILFCPKEKRYTLHEICECGEKALSLKPAKYSPEDKFGSYRRRAKRKQFIEQGLLEE